MEKEEAAISQSDMQTAYHWASLLWREVPDEIHPIYNPSVGVEQGKLLDEL